MKETCFQKYGYTRVLNQHNLLCQYNFYRLLGRYETWSRLYGQFLTSHDCVLSPKTFELMSLFTGMEEWLVVKWGEMQLNDRKALDQRNIMCLHFTFFFVSIPVLEQQLQVSNTRRNSRIFRVSFQDIKYVQCTFIRNLLP